MTLQFWVLEPLLGIRLEGAGTHSMQIPVGASLRLLHRPWRYPKVAEVEYNGYSVILFYDDLCNRCKIRVEGRAMQAGA